MSGVSKSGSRAADQVIQWGKSYWIETCFERAEGLKPCPIGASGACCTVCNMGPCRFVTSTDERVDKGVCGARLETIASRNLLRMAATGAAAASEHARDMAFALRGIASGEIDGLQISDMDRLKDIAVFLGVNPGGRDLNDIGVELAGRLLDELRRQTEEPLYMRMVPERTAKRWKEWGIVPRGVDREITDALYRTHIGVDNDPDDILLSALRVSLSDGWISSMITSDIADIIFGRERTFISGAGLGSLSVEHVNVVLIGDEPVLAKMLLELSADAGIREYAVTKGAKGVRVSSIFAPGYGLPVAGGFTNQELCIMTGIADAVVVGEQCIMPALKDVAGSFHTKVISTSGRARFPEIMFTGYEIKKIRETALNILRLAIENFPERTGLGERIDEFCPADRRSTVLNPDEGFINSLSRAITERSIRGIVCLTGYDNPRVEATGIHRYLADELIREDVLIFSTASASATCAAYGFFNPDRVTEYSGSGLKRAFHEYGIPPVIHMGGPSDNARILSLLSAMTRMGGITDEIGGLPVVMIAPEWMAEREVSTCCFFSASGVPVIMGGNSPVRSTKEVQRIMEEIWAERFRGLLHFESDHEKIFDMVLSHIDIKRGNQDLRNMRHAGLDTSGEITGCTG